jgi:hypothetical protein
MNKKKLCIHDRQWQKRCRVTDKAMLVNQLSSIVAKVSQLLLSGAHQILASGPLIVVGESQLTLRVTERHVIKGRPYKVPS